MAGLISRSLSATLKDCESPAGRLGRVRFEGFRYFARRKWSWRRAAYTGMRLLHRPRGIDPPFDTALPSRCPWLCTPCHKYPWIRVPLALSSRVLFFAPAAPRRPPIEITSVVKIAFYCRFPFDAIRNPLLHRSREEIRKRLSRNSGWIRGVWFWGEFKLQPRVRSIYSLLNVFFIGTRGFGL